MKILKPWQVTEILHRRNWGWSAYKLGKKYGVTARHIRRVIHNFNGTAPIMRPCGCKPQPITAKEFDAVADAYDLYHHGAINLERDLRLGMDIKISHNRIHEILLQLKKAKKSFKKAKRRKWVRFERYKSNSMWHTDWTKMGDEWLIAYIDDASRFVTGWGIFKHATTANSILVLERAIAAYGVPKAMLTGRDIQFYVSKRKNCTEPEASEFDNYLKAHKIKHILARVNHPQTNGKVERLFGTVKQKKKEFDSLEALFHWYNDVRPHMSLRQDVLETPAQAFLRKMNRKKKIAVEMVVR